MFEIFFSVSTLAFDEFKLAVIAIRLRHLLDRAMRFAFRRFLNRASSVFGGDGIPRTDALISCLCCGVNENAW
jgi:hypothetical protein